MVPYQGRLALRIARVVLAAARAWLVCSNRWVRARIWLALLCRLSVYSLGAVFERALSILRSARPSRSWRDATFFAILDLAWPRGTGMPALAVRLSAGGLRVLLHDLARAAITVAAALFIALLAASRTQRGLVWTVVATGGAGRRRGVSTSAISKSACPTRCATT